MIKLGTYKGLNLSLPSYEVSDEDIRTEIQKLLDQKKIERPKDGVAESGDYIQLDFDAFYEDKKIDACSRVNYHTRLGQAFLPDVFEQAIIGKKKGDRFSLEYHTKVNEDFLMAEYDDMRFDIHLKEIMEHVSPQLTDKLVKSLNIPETETVDTLYAYMENHLTKQNKLRAYTELVNEMMSIILGGSIVNYEEAVLSQVYEEIVESFRLEVASHRVTWTEYLELVETSEAEVLKACEEEAKTYLKEKMVLDEIVKRDNIDLSHYHVDDPEKYQVVIHYLVSQNEVKGSV